MILGVWLDFISAHNLKTVKEWEIKKKSKLKNAVLAVIFHLANNK